MRRVEQLVQRKSYRNKQRKNLEPVEQPAEVRGDQHPPLLAIERTIPRQRRDGGIAVHSSAPLFAAVLHPFKRRSQIAAPKKYTLAFSPGNTRVRRRGAGSGHGSIMMSTRRSVTVGSFEPVCPMGSCWISVRAIPSA